MGLVGEAMSTLGIMQTRRDVEAWQESLFTMEEKLEVLEDSNDSLGKIILRVKRRNIELEKNIGEAKKVCIAKTN